MDTHPSMDARGIPIRLGERTLIMGILNVTPDSFSDGGDHNAPDAAVLHAKAMIEAGADMIDVGGESTRPGADEVSADQEIDRVVPVIRRLSREVGVPISVDTYKARVAEAALEAGAHIVNDVWGLQRDPEIAPVAARFGAPVIAMHNQKGTAYEDMLPEILTFLRRSIEIALQAGIPDQHIVLDPGIGFGKTPEQNMDLMARLDEVVALGYPVLLGTSRKSMLGKILDLPAKERAVGTAATSVMGIAQGVSILRVHDIKENREAALVADAIYRRYRPWT